MPDSTVETKSYGAEDFLSAGTVDRADEAVAEIFTMMLSLDIKAVEGPTSDLPPSEQDERTAFVGFSGAMRGSCQVRMRPAGARLIASAMLGGAPIAEDDEDSISDALGEMCNMLAGGWKNGIPELSAACTLSPPTVISGQDYKVHVRKASVKLARTYLFEGHALYLILHCEDIQSARQ